MIIKIIRSIFISYRKVPNHSTPENRSQERHRRIAVTALSSAAAKGVSILTAFISVPLTVDYLGAERYGLWMTISSIIAFLSFADLGIGNGLLNAISEANGRDDQEMAEEYVSSAFFMLSAIAMSSAVIFSVVYPFIPWQRVFNVSSQQAVAEAGPATFIFIGCFLLNIPLGVTQRIQMGFQEGFLSNIWQGFGSLLGLGGVVLAIYFKAGLPYLVLAMAGAPALVACLNGVVLFGFKQPWLRPKISCISWNASRKIYRMGILFFILQLAAAIAFSSDNIVAAQVLGPGSVTEYSVAMRLFSVITMALGMILAPMWPAYGESIARGDIVWAKRMLARSLVWSFLLSVVPSIFLVLFGKDIIQIWVGPQIAPTLMLLMGLGVWTVIASVSNALAMFLNGVNALRFQVICASMMSISAIILKIFLAKVVGISGIIWGTVIAYVIFAAIPYAVMIPKLLYNMENAQKKHSSLS